MAPASELWVEPSADTPMKLVVVVSGAVTLTQANQRAELEAGSFSWLDGGRPFTLHTPASQHLVIRLDRDALAMRHPDVDHRPRARGFDHTGERITGQLLMALGHDGRDLGDAEIEVAVSSLVTSLGLCARRSAEDVQRLRVARALRTIHAELADPLLTPERVAATQGVSRRYLDTRVREQTGHTLASHIRRLRLERCARELVTRQDEPAAAIALRTGFVDASHFTRAFKKHFGRTPSAYRRQQMPRSSTIDPNTEIAPVTTTVMPLG